jgi:hypothetical protein
MTNFKRQLLNRLFLVKGLKLGLEPKQAFNYASMLMSQVFVLIEVYKELDAYMQKWQTQQMSQEGPWTETSIYTIKQVRLHFHTEEHSEVIFWVYYSHGDDWADSLKCAHKNPWNGQEYLFDIVHPVLTAKWESYFYNHNYVSPELFQKLYLQDMIEYFSK